jgi:tetratricopeptide (TPR) repeat protein
VSSQRLLLAAVCGMSLVLGGVFLLRCRSEEKVQPDESAVVDSELLAFLSLARAHHHEANLLEQSGDLRGAVAALRKIVDAPKPHPGQRVPEVEEVLADAYARIADLELQLKDSASARHDVETGLLHATDPTYFRGHLLEVFGIVEESRTAELVDAGRDAEADKARAHALALLREAVDVQEAVIARVLDAGRDR